jgi:flagellar motor switch protein FliM
MGREGEGERSPGHHEEREAHSLTGISLTVTTRIPQELCQGLSENVRRVLSPEPTVQGENQLPKVVLRPL